MQTMQIRQTRQTMQAGQMSAPAFLPAATHSYLERAASSLREAITSTSVPGALRPAPTSPRSGRPPPCWPPGHVRWQRAGASGRRTPGCCWPRWPRAQRVGDLLRRRR